MRLGYIKYCFCTSTLLEGVNVPVDNLFVFDHKKGLSDLSVIDAFNLMGRAGRVSLNEFEKAPIIGNGTKYLSHAKSIYGSELLGAESIWFGLLIENGCLGIFAFIVILLYPLFMKKLLYKKVYAALALGWLSINTMTTIPGLGNTFYYTLIILLYKAQLINENEKAVNYNSRL